MPEQLLEEQRENWGSRAGFVLAAIGSAVGLGNLWGFPYKLYSYGGGAFLIPYLVAMLLIGIPLLIAEFSLGHLTQRATPDAFRRAHRSFAFVGWWQIILSFVIITYYAVILAYCLSFFYYSLVGIAEGALPWAGKGIEGVQNAKTFFFTTYLHWNQAFAPGRLQWHIVVSLVITWVAMYLCIFRGLRLVGKVVLWTVPLPWLMLLILTIRGLTLDGAIQGLEYYLEPNWSRLADPATWRWAFGQMFFSMSLAFGIMITYASFLHRKSDLNNNSVIVGLADMGTSFVAGLAVFATLGGMAFATRQAGAAVPVETVAESGPSLAFVAFPYALAQLPYAAWFSLLFFASLLLLGIDSAFSITESVLASIVDKTGWSRDWTLVLMSAVGLAVGLLFCTQGGLSWLGTFDDFINGTWGITLTALLECFVLGWLFRLRRLRDHANERSDWKVGRWWDWTIRLVIPVVLGALFSWSLFDGLADPGGYVHHYKPDEVSVTVPPADALPDRPILQLQFVARFSGKAEHTFELTEPKPRPQAATTPATAPKAKPDQPPPVEGWQVLESGRPQPLPGDFTMADLVGKGLRFTTAAVTPDTAYAVRCRWGSRPKTDPRTQLPVPVPEDRQPPWVSLGELTTTRRRAGLNVGSVAGLCLMALAPVLAVAIAVVRFRRTEDEAIHIAYADDRPRGRGAGAVAAALGLAGLAALAAALVTMLGLSRLIRLRGGVDAAASRLDRLVLTLLIAGGLAGLVSLLLAGLGVLRRERQQIRSAMIARLAAGLGVLNLGICGGLALALAIITTSFPVTPIEYDNQLSATSYVILVAMLGLIFIGLGWCFYRAIRAAGAGAPEQLPENAD
jgi:NSS family neurotransmitter:Na+ symporter